MSFGPRKIAIQDIAMNTLGSMIAGFIASIIIVFIVFMVSTLIDIPGTFSQAGLAANNNPMFPFILSCITFFSTMIMIFLSVKLLTLTDGERYKKNTIIYGQIALFGILTYLCVTPIYVFTGLIDYNNIMIVFIFHVLILTF